MRRRYLLLGGFAAVIILVDQISKAWALDRLEDGSAIRLIGSLQLKLTFNTGTAFSFGGGSGLGPWIAILVLVVVGAVIWYGRMVSSNTLAAALGLILGGAVGNLIDRAARGEGGFMSGPVTDFIDLQWWPVFNIADAAIVVGAIILVASLIFGSGDAASSAPTGHDDGSSNSEGSP